MNIYKISDDMGRLDHTYYSSVKKAMDALQELAEGEGETMSTKELTKARAEIREDFITFVEAGDLRITVETIDVE